MVYSWGENIIRFACTNGSRAWPLCSAISHFPNHKITIIHTHAISLTTYVYRPKYSYYGNLRPIGQEVASCSY